MRAPIRLNAKSQDQAYNPFISHAFLSALEASGSATARTGWQPQHLVAETQAGAVLGVVPAYLKSHSRGEYVFDAGWAEAYERAGGSYYPKVQVSVPFTPATGRRLLVPPGRGGRQNPPRTCERPDGACQAARCLIRARDVRAAERSGACSANSDSSSALTSNSTGRTRTTRTFDDFLGALAARKRKAIKRERREALEHGIDGAMAHRFGSDRKHLGHVLRVLHGDRLAQMGPARISRARSIRSIGETMRDKVLLVMAKRAGRYIAGAINFIGSRHAVRPPLGRGRASPVPALRALLLPSH